MTMSRSPLVALLFARAALASFGIPYNNKLAQVAAAANDPGATACVAAEGVVSVCVNSIPDFTAAPVLEQEACLCCYSATNLAPVYGLCADYIATSAPAYSTESQLFSEISVACVTAGNVCGGGSGAGPTTGAGPSPTPSAPAPTTPVPTTAGSAAGNAEPPACTSFLNILSSCSSEVGDFRTAAGSAIASCICPSGDTAFDGYAADCASWASTGDPTDYSAVYAVRTFCASDASQATKGGSAQTTRFPVASGGSGLGIGGGSGSGSRKSSSSSSDAPAATVTVTPGPTVSHSALAGHIGADGAVAWMGSLLAAFLSFLFLL